jgi:hypothetical protein
MAILDRVRNIILSPKTEWLAIDQEQETPVSLLTKYVIPLLLIGALAAFIGYGFIGLDSFFLKIKGIRWGAWFAIRQLASGILGYFIATYVIDSLAPSFSSEKNLGKSAQLVAYASTPSWIAAFFLVLPTLSILGLFGLYGIYLFYAGLPVLKKTPDDKRIVYMVIAALLVIVVSWAAQWCIALVLKPLMGDPFDSSLNEIRDLIK